MRRASPVLIHSARNVVGTSKSPPDLAVRRALPTATPGLRSKTVAAASTVRTELHAVTFCADDTGHRLQVLGYVRGPRPAGVDCESPLRVVCGRCDYRTVWQCQGHRESRCRPCAARYRRRVRAVADSGMRRAVGYLYLLTLTAPGRRAHRLPDGTPCRCTPEGGVELASWNTSHSRRWNHFRTRLRQAHPELQFFRGVEVQQRGALHDHAMVWSAEPLSLAFLRTLAMDAGFGHSVDLAPCEPGSRKAAYYVSKYVTKATDKREDVPWLGELVNFATGEVTEGLVPGRYRTWSMSREWGDTMAQVRAVAAEYARRKSDARGQAEEDGALAVLRAVLGDLTSSIGLPPGSDPPVPIGT